MRAATSFPAAIELLASDGLAQLTMDDPAKRARVLRANLYRLFSGKAALLRELVRVCSPLEPSAPPSTRSPTRPPKS